MRTYIAIFIVSVLLPILHVKGGSHSGEDEEAVYQHVLKTKLNARSRPAANSSQPITAMLTLAIMNIEYLDQNSGVLDLLLMSNTRWNDDFIRWDPALYNDTNVLSMPQEDVWYPDIDLYNSRNKMSKDRTHVMVRSNGKISHTTPVHTSTHCDIDLKNFPYDKQTCVLRFGSWTYNGDKLDLIVSKRTVDRSAFFEENAEWDLLEFTAERLNTTYRVTPYIELRFTLKLARKTSYYTYMYIGPVIILSLLAPFIFLLPPGDQQKITLGVGLLICFTFFFMDLSITMPAMHAHTPLIAQYYMAMYVILAVAMAISTLIANLARRAINIKHPPEILKKVILSWLGRCLCISPTMYCDMTSGDDDLEQVIVSQKDESTTDPVQIREWMLIATVLDRLFFLLYIALTCVLTFLILVSRG